MTYPDLLTHEVQPLNLWYLLLLSSEIPLKPQNWNFRVDWLCNSSVTVPIFPSASADCMALRKGVLLQSYRLWTCNPSRDKSTWFYNNPPHVHARILGNPCQKAELKIFLKTNFWAVQLFCQRVSQALHRPTWFSLEPLSQY